MAIYDMFNSLDDFEEGDIIYIPATNNYSETICEFAPVDREDDRHNPTFYTERAIIKEGSTWNPYPDCEITYEPGCPVRYATEEEEEWLNAAFSEKERKHKWHRTADILPDDDVVAGIWTDEDGVRFITLCYYDAKDKLWYEADAEVDHAAEVLKAPEYWIEIPKPE